MGNHDAEKISAGIRKMDQNSTTVNAGFKSSRPNNKTLPLKDNSDELSNLNTAPGSLQTIPTEIVGPSNSQADLMPNTRGSTHQAEVTNPKSSTPDNRRLSH